MRASLLRPLYSLPPPQVPNTKRYVLYRTRCSNSDSEGVDPMTRDIEALSGLFGQRIEEQLTKDENRALLQGLDAASRRVDEARAELEDMKSQREVARQTNEYARQLKNQEAEITESLNELEEARAMVEQAEQSLSPGFNSAEFSNEGDRGRYRERLESVKTGAVSSLVGTLASLPITLSQSTEVSQVIVHSLIVLISCGLFGVTFRYAVRTDLDNIQLKTGTAFAFGFVKGLAELEVGRSLELSIDGCISFAIDGGISVAQNIFIFFFVAVALDSCFKMMILSPFPITE